MDRRHYKRKILAFIFFPVCFFMFEGCRDYWETYISGPAIVNGKITLGKSGFIYYCFNNTNTGEIKAIFSKSLKTSVVRKGKRFFFGKTEIKFPKGSNGLLIGEDGSFIFVCIPKRAFCDHWGWDRTSGEKVIVNLDEAKKDEAFKEKWLEFMNLRVKSSWPFTAPPYARNRNQKTGRLDEFHFPKKLRIAPRMDRRPHPLEK